MSKRNKLFGTILLIFAAVLTSFAQENKSIAFPGAEGGGKTALELFKNPAIMDFTIIDPTFAGKSSAGDPRWRLGL